jgi:hypothetical protein
MYSSDHAPPRFHARYGEFEAQLRLTFTDGLVREVDLSRDLWGPMAEPLQGPAYFRQVHVDPELGTVVWPNGYDLDPDVLHGDHEPVGRPAAQASR